MIKMIVFYQIDDVKRSGVGSFDSKVKKLKEKMKTKGEKSVTVPAAAAWCCSANTLRFRDRRFFF